MKTRFSIIIGVCLLFSVSVSAQDGQSIFKKNCGICHTVGKGKMVGPDLKGAHTKFEEGWLLKWIKSSQTLVKKGDPIAVKLYEENDKLVMPDQNISDDEIKTILAYIKTESEQPAEAAPTAKSEENISTSEAKPEPYDYHKKESNAVSWRAATIAMIGFCVVLVIIIVAMGNVISGMAKTIYSKKTDLDQPGTES